jgi:uncharacterized protein YneF (UPF0154 family)
LKRFLITLSIVILLGIGLFTAWYLKTKAKNDLFAQRNIEYDYSIISDENLQKSQEIRDNHLKKAYEIRNMWKSNALKQKLTLKEIFNQPSKENFKKLRNIVGNGRHYPLMARGSYLPNGLSKRGATTFSWQMYQSSVDPDPVADAHSLGPYLAKGDTPLSFSGAAGSKMIVIWVSGRITERSMEENPALRKNPVEGMPAYIDVETEIEPAFDFLKS